MSLPPPPLPPGMGTVAGTAPTIRAKATISLLPFPQMKKTSMRPNQTLIAQRDSSAFSPLFLFL